MQISLQSLFIVLGYTAVFCVTLLNAGPVSVMILRGIALISLLFALLAVWYRNGEKRAYWVGYLHGGGAYALLTFYALGGVTENRVWNDKQIVSGELANAAYGWLPESKRPASSYKLSRPQTARRLVGRNAVLQVPSVPLPPPSFRYLFHSAFIVFCGWLGGLVGVWTFRTGHKRSAAKVPKSDDLRVAKEALLAIVKTPTVTSGDTRVKCAALRRLAMFVDSAEVVALLLYEISFRQPRTTSTISTLENYPAAQSLAMGGATARSGVISVPSDRFLSDKEVALRAHVLVAIDEDAEIAVHRLKRTLEQCESTEKDATDAVSATADSKGRAAMRLNLARMLGYIEDPTFRRNGSIGDPQQEI